MNRTLSGGVEMPVNRGCKTEFFGTPLPARF
jgi:hypothetical protein